MTAPVISTTTLSKLASYDTPTISNAIELFEIRPNDAGYMDCRIRAAFPEMPPIVGFAATATFRASPCSKTAADRVGGYVALEKQVEQFKQLPGPAIVVFQDLDDRPVGATFGEVMCSTYQAFGSAGLITSGGGRDLVQVKALNYPVFTGSTVCSHAYCQIVDVGSPVRVGGLPIRMGDLLHGDANGVTSIPLEIADEVADVAEAVVAAEMIVLEYVKGQEPKEVAQFAEKRRAMAAALATLRNRVSRKVTG